VPVKSDETAAADSGGGGGGQLVSTGPAAAYAHAASAPVLDTATTSTASAATAITASTVTATTASTVTATTADVYSGAASNTTIDSYLFASSNADSLLSMQSSSAAASAEDTLPSDALNRTINYPPVPTFAPIVFPEVPNDVIHHNNAINQLDNESFGSRDLSKKAIAKGEPDKLLPLSPPLSHRPSAPDRAALYETAAAATAAAALSDKRADPAGVPHPIEAESLLLLSPLLPEAVDSRTAAEEAVNRDVLLAMSQLYHDVSHHCLFCSSLTSSLAHTVSLTH
jgi:hypothetical protein